MDWSNDVKKVSLLVLFCHSPFSLLSCLVCSFFIFSLNIFISLSSNVSRFLRRLYGQLKVSKVDWKDLFRCRKVDRTIKQAMDQWFSTFFSRGTLGQQYQYLVIPFKAKIGLKINESGNWRHPTIAISRHHSLPRHPGWEPLPWIVHTLPSITIS